MKSLQKKQRDLAIVFYTVFAITVGLFLFSGINGSIIAGKYIDSLERNSLQTLALTASTQISPEKVQALEGDQSDLNKPEYVFLKNQLKDIKSANTDARFVYLLGKNENNEIVFLVDSEDPGTEGYSYPGQIYFEATESEKRGFEKDAMPYTEGPISDRWGDWVSGLAQVRSQSGDVVAQIGFDVDAKVWVDNASYVETLIALISFAVVFFLIILFLGARRLLVALERERSAKYNLEKEEAKLVSLTENTEDYIWSCDRDYKTLVSNSSAKKFFKEWYHFDLVAGVETAHIHYDGVSNFRTEYERAKKGEKFIVEFFKKVESGERWIECAFNPIVASSGEVLGVTVFARDISDRKQVEKFRQELVGFASHELRTPLTGIKWFTELMLTDKQETLSPKHRNTLESIYKTTEETLRLVKNFLESSKMDRNGAFIVLAKKNNLSYLMKDVLKAENIFFEKKKITYELSSFFNEPHEFFFDEEKIRYVFQNLVNNAIKYSKDGSHVMVSGSVDGSSIKVSVKDSGMGIPDKDKEKIFNRAYRATNAINGGIEGNGLGLYLVKAIVVAHKGKIYFESKEGVGTEFFVELPLVRN